MKNRRRKSPAIRPTMEAAARQIQPLVHELLQIEHDAAGIDFQFERIPYRHAGPEKLLEKVGKALDRRFESVTGLKASEGVGKDDVRRVLDSLRRAFEEVEIDIGSTVPLPRTFTVWVDDLDLYEQADGSEDLRDYRGNHAKQILVRKLSLNPDGTAKNYRAVREEIEWEREGDSFPLRVF